MRIALILLFVAGCVAKPPESDRQTDHQKVEQELGGEVSLKADRSELDEMRKQIPPEKRKSNDELALYLQMMNQGKEQPQTVRDKFTNLVSKRRTSYRDKVTKLRDDYRRAETKRKDEFLDQQKSKRDKFTAGKPNATETREFFGQQEKDRESFFTNERDRRASFESDINAQSKDFESYMREKTNEFNEQYRLYSKKFSEREKPKRAATGEEAPAPAQTLGPDN